jgi:hypothetical protein
MQRLFHGLLISLVVLGIVGCSNDSAPNSQPKADTSTGRPSPPPPPPPPPPSSPLPGDVKSQKPADRKSQKPAGKEEGIPNLPQFIG